MFRLGSSEKNPGIALLCLIKHLRSKKGDSKPTGLVSWILEIERLEPWESRAGAPARRGVATAHAWATAESRTSVRRAQRVAPVGIRSADWENPRHASNSDSDYGNWSPAQVSSEN